MVSPSISGIGKRYRGAVEIARGKVIDAHRQVFRGEGESYYLLSVEDKIFLRFDDVLRRHRGAIGRGEHHRVAQPQRVADLCAFHGELIVPGVARGAAKSQIV